MFLHLNFHFRHVLACLHYNENLKRMSKKTKDGKIYTKMSYPKYKLGEEAVRNVKVQPTYSKCKSWKVLKFLIHVITDQYEYVFTEYFEDLTALLMTTTKGDLSKVRQDISKKIPEPLTSQFTERRSREAAIKN